VAEESKLAVGASLWADRDLATALVAFEEVSFDFTNRIAGRAFVRWKAAGVGCVLPQKGLPGESLLAWHLAELVEWQIPLKSPKLVSTGNHLGLHWGRTQSCRAGFGASWSPAWTGG
jgi:hypothetical protein